MSTGKKRITALNQKYKTERNQKTNVLKATHGALKWWENQMLNGENLVKKLQTESREHFVQYGKVVISFEDTLENSLRGYYDRLVETYTVIEWMSISPISWIRSLANLINAKAISDFNDKRNSNYLKALSDRSVNRATKNDTAITISNRNSVTDKEIQTWIIKTTLADGDNHNMEELMKRVSATKEEVIEIIEELKADGKIAEKK